MLQTILNNKQAMKYGLMNYGSKVVAFSNVGLHKFKMAAGGQNSRICRRRLADRFLLSRGILVPKGMFVAFVVSSQYISLHPDRHPSVDSITQIHS
jgi:hypothetical protein